MRLFIFPFLLGFCLTAISQHHLKRNDSICSFLLKDINSESTFYVLLRDIAPSPFSSKKFMRQLKKEVGLPKKRVEQTIEIVKENNLCHLNYLENYEVVPNNGYKTFLMDKYGDSSVLLKKPSVYEFSFPVFLSESYFIIDVIEYDVFPFGIKWSYLINIKDENYLVVTKAETGVF